MKNDLTTYWKYAPLMDTGDTILYIGGSVIGSMIGWWEKHILKSAADKMFTHGNMVLRFTQYELFRHMAYARCEWSRAMLDQAGESTRRWVLDARASGVYPVLLSDYLETYNGHVYWYPLKAEITPDTRQAIGKYGMYLAGRGYDFKGLFKSAVGAVSVSMNRLFCTESIFLSYRDGGGIVQGNIAPRPDMMPGLGVYEEPIQIF